ncbi:MAG: PPK2 family polyphosphate kinase [Saprospiraceae bacterium]
MAKIELSKISTESANKVDKEKTIAETGKMVKQIGELTKLIYAEKKQSVLIVLQGMDASGKDGTLKNVFADCTALPLEAYAFKKPTEEEFAHDFLWRIHKQAPAKGNIKIFVRSHYEDILIQAVHKWISPDQVRLRMDAINCFEELLQFDNNTTILKFYLHISHKKQLEKLEERRTNPEHQWKFKAEDFDESKLWDQYRKCYEYAINNSTIPWHIIPADQKWYRDYCVAKIVVNCLQKLDPKLPTLNNGK